MNETLTGRLPELKNKGMIQVCNPECSRGRLREQSRKVFKSYCSNGVPQKLS